MVRRMVSEMRERLGTLIDYRGTARGAESNRDLFGRLSLSRCGRITFALRARTDDDDGRLATGRPPASQGHEAHQGSQSLVTSSTIATADGARSRGGGSSAADGSGRINISRNSRPSLVAISRGRYSARSLCVLVSFVALCVGLRRPVVTRPKAEGAKAP